VGRYGESIVAEARGEVFFQRFLGHYPLKGFFGELLTAELPPMPRVALYRQFRICRPAEPQIERGEPSEPNQVARSG